MKVKWGIVMGSWIWPEPCGILPDTHAWKALGWQAQAMEVLESQSHVMRWSGGDVGFLVVDHQGQVADGQCSTPG